MRADLRHFWARCRIRPTFKCPHLRAFLNSQCIIKNNVRITIRNTLVASYEIQSTFQGPPEDGLPCSRIYYDSLKAGHCNIESNWDVMAHGDAREGKWRGKWRMEWGASTLHATSEHGVSSITTADAHTSAASSRLNWRPCQFKWTSPFRRKTKFVFCACAITFHTQFTSLNFGARISDVLGKYIKFNPLGTKINLLAPELFF